MILKQLPLVLATLLAGLSAGICFTWGNAVTPGIGKLDDFAFLSAFQSMNRVILNPLFLFIFFSPFLFATIGAVQHRHDSFLPLGLLIGAALIYFFGLVLVTIFGNVPLNELLDRTALTSISHRELSVLRQQFESPWKLYHTIRTWAASISFLLLVVALLFTTIN